MICKFSRTSGGIYFRWFPVLRKVLFVKVDINNKGMTRSNGPSPNSATPDVILKSSGNLWLSDEFKESKS